MKLLGVDYGSKRVGLALADTVEGYVLPWKVLEGLADSVLIQKISEIISEEKIDGLVFGEPLQLSGEAGSASERVRAFVGLLTQAVHIPTYFVDERFSSAYADHFTKEFGMPRDAVAAAAILETYIQQIKK